MIQSQVRSIEKLKNVGDVPKTRDQVIARQSYFTDSELRIGPHDCDILIFSENI